jgi:polysaccharide biosynthesis protein PslH
MRVAWVTSQIPDRAGPGGAGTELALLAGLAGRHQLVLVTSGRPEHGDLAAVEALGVEVVVVPWEGRPWPRGRARMGWRLLTATPTVELWACGPRVPAAAAALAELHRRAPVDLVHLTLGEQAPLAGALPGVPSALLLFDVYSRDARRAAARPGLAAGARLARRVEAAKLARWEARWYRRPTAVACLSPVDAEALTAMAGRPVAVVPPPVPDDFFDPPTVPRSADTVVFVGSLRWGPNVDAVLWLCQSVWPLVTAAVPSARLVVAGRDPGPEVRAAVAGAGGRLAADVPDIRPCYWSAAVAVAPVRLGSGLRNKIVHAMACGAPVVSTTVAAEGTGARHGEHALLADTAAGLAEAVASSLASPAAAQARAGRARQLVERHRASRVPAEVEAWWATALSG